MLNHEQIDAAVASGDIQISPYDRRLLKQGAYSLRLGDQFRQWTSGEPLDPTDPRAAHSLGATSSASKIVLAPGEFILATTLERLVLGAGVSGFLSTPSHLARFGISAVMSSCVVAPNFGRRAPTAITLELTSSNPSPVILRSGHPICSLVLTRIDPAAYELPPRAGYDGLDTPSAPRYADEVRALAADGLDVGHPSFT